MCSHQINENITSKQSSHLLVFLVDAPNARNAVIERQKSTRPSYFPHKSHTCWGNGTGYKIGVSEAIQKRLEWENLIYSLLPRFIIYWVFMLPSYIFWNSFCGWLGETSLCQNLRASKFKIWGTPPTCSFPTQNRVCLAPTQPHLYTS
jgi:hypothetical protein